MLLEVIINIIVIYKLTYNFIPYVLSGSLISWSIKILCVFDTIVRENNLKENNRTMKSNYKCTMKAIS